MHLTLSSNATCIAFKVYYITSWTPRESNPCPNTMLYCFICDWIKTLHGGWSLGAESSPPGLNGTFILFLKLLCLCWCLVPVLYLPAQACRDFLDLAESHSRRWQRVLQHEREQRAHLEETIEQLAKQHNSLERAWREAPTHAVNTPNTPTTNTGETCHPCRIVIIHKWIL